MSATADQVFLLPDLGEGLTEAEIVTWRVKVGDVVTIDQVVVDVETAKAQVEVPCPYAGRVTALHTEEGVTLDVGRPLITVSALDPADAGKEAYREQERAGSGNVLIGYGTGTARSARRRRVGPRPGRPAHAGDGSANGHRPQASDRANGHAPAAGPANGNPDAPRVISPIVRRLAKDNGVDVAALTGSGPAGLVLRSDVESAIGGALSPDRTGPGTPASATPAGRDEDGVLRIPLRGLRKVVADKLSRSRREIPEATVWVDVDATGMLETRAALNADDPEHPVSVLALLARFTTDALRRFPELNARVDTENEEIIQYSAVHLGIAAQTDRGLIVPVIRDADRLTTAGLAAELATVTAQARTGNLPAERLTGGTFTLNNYGVFGVDGSTPIINHPEAAILGVGRIFSRPWDHQGRLELRKVTQLSLAFDHRVCDGGVAGGFLRAVADAVENPARLLARY
ncbi:MAG: dihydrolipoamide acetyltransferase family protein [Actinoallomurus sp.]